MWRNYASWFPVFTIALHLNYSPVLLLADQAFDENTTGPENMVVMDNIAARSETQSI